MSLLISRVSKYDIRPRRWGDPARSTRVQAVLLATLLIASAVQRADAQRLEPYSTVSVSGGAVRDAREGFLHQFWMPEYVGEVFVSTPTHLGHLELGVSQHRYRPLSNDVPAFDAVLAYASWNIGVRFPRQVRIAVGPRLGVYFMDFDVASQSGIRTESEAAVGAQARITVHPLRFIGLYAGADYMQAFTFVRTRLYHFSGGLVVTIESPDWLIKGLR